jgi:hypothetical protein
MCSCVYYSVDDKQINLIEFILEELMIKYGNIHFKLNNYRPTLDTQSLIVTVVFEKYTGVKL